MRVSRLLAGNRLARNWPGAIDYAPDDRNAQLLIETLDAHQRAGLAKFLEHGATIAIQYATLAHSPAVVPDASRTCDGRYKMSYFEVPGARLYYETRGTGPLLLLIPGANGDANVFPPLADLLAADFTVVTYDRRGYTRSALNGAQDYAHRLETDADDAQRLIEHLSDEPAAVFGTSSGGVIALQLLIDHPHAVRALVSFEPAAMRLLPDGDKWFAFFEELYDLYRQSGPAPARTLFVKQCFPQVDHPIMSRTPDPERAPTSMANANYFFERELRQYTAVVLDMEKLSQRAAKIIPAMGLASVGFPDGEVARALGLRLSRDLLELPDGHVGYVTSSEEFARRLVRRLKQEAGHG